MVTDFKVFFYARKNYVNRDGKVAILVRLALNGQKIQFSSKDKNIAVTGITTKGVLYKPGKPIKTLAHIGWGTVQVKPVI